jgi:hypothetical protein
MDTIAECLRLDPPGLGSAWTDAVCAGALDEPAAKSSRLAAALHSAGHWSDEANAEVGLTAIGARSPFL